jgi:hypothetical protein
MELLLQAGFAGAPELRAQAVSAVAVGDKMFLELKVDQSGPKADVLNRIPVQAVVDGEGYDGGLLLFPPRQNLDAWAWALSRSVNNAGSSMSMSMSMSMSDFLSDRERRFQYGSVSLQWTPVLEMVTRAGAVPHSVDDEGGGAPNRACQRSFARARTVERAAHSEPPDEEHQDARACRPSPWVRAHPAIHRDVEVLQTAEHVRTVA